MWALTLCRVMMQESVQHGIPDPPNSPGARVLLPNPSAATGTEGICSLCSQVEVSCWHSESWIAQSALSLTANYSGEAHLWVIGSSLLTMEMSSTESTRTTVFRYSSRLILPTEAPEVNPVTSPWRNGKSGLYSPPGSGRQAEHVCMAGKRRGLLWKELDDNTVGMYASRPLCVWIT